MLKASLVIVGAMLLAPQANATVIYSLTAGTLSYLNNFLGSSEGDSFSFTGPQPVSIQGTGGNNVGYDTLEQLNSPFTLSLSLLIDDTGNTTGLASANGVDYGPSQYTGTAELVSSPITLTAGTLTTTVAAEITGQINVCTPDATCPAGSNPFDASFGPLDGSLTVTYASLVGTPNYSLTTAVFTTPQNAPEPASMVLFLAGAALIALWRVRLVSKLSQHIVNTVTR